MKSMNRVFLMGHLGADPEVKMSRNGKAYARMSLATNRAWLNSEEQWEKKTDWHSVFVWGPLAERCRNLNKGTLVFVEGALSYWKVAEEGLKKDGYKNAIHATEIKFLSAPKSSLEAANEPSDQFLGGENLDNSEAPLNHNAVAHPA